MYSSDNGNGTFTNPLIPVDFPDPDIIRVGGDFYMVSSSFTDAPGIPVAHSRDLVNWTIIGHAYERLPESNPAYSMRDSRVAYRGGSWAPTIRHHRGTFYIGFCTPAEGFFLAAAVAPEGPYELHSFGGRELYDPGLFFDEDDRVYVVHGVNDIYLTELSAAARAILGPPRLLYSTSYGTPLEGSHVHKRNGWYFICNTCRGYNGIQIVYRSRALTGPYESRLVTADDMNYAGAGLHQGGFVDLANGDTWFFLFQDRDYVGRVPVLLPVTWQDDWPRLGDPANFWKVAPTHPLPATGAAAIPLPRNFHDDFDAEVPGRQWHWNHNPDDSRWSLTTRPGWLRLIAGPATGLLDARNTLTVKVPAGGCTATTRLDVTALRPGLCAGICVLGFPYAFLAAECGESGVRVVMVNDGTRVAESAVFPATDWRLRAEVDAAGIARFSFRLDGGDWLEFGAEVRLAFSVRNFLGNKFGLFCFSRDRDSERGWADFDDVQLELVRADGNLHSAFKPIPACSYDAEVGTDTHRLVEKLPAQILVGLHEGDWVRFDRIDFGTGVGAFSVRASPAEIGGRIEIRMEGPEGTLLGTCPVPGIGERNPWLCPWDTFSCLVDRVSGVRTICLRFTGGDGYLMRLESFSFQPLNPPPRPYEPSV